MVVRDNGRHTSVILFVIAIASQGIFCAFAHSHQGCGHSLVAEEAKRWANLHSQHKHFLHKQAADAAAGDLQYLATAGSQAGDRPEARRLIEAAGATVPIRIWVEYQGITELPTEGRQKLYDTVNIALGVLQKFYKVRRPAPGKLLVRPMCSMWDSANYCNAHQPDFLQGGGDNSCGSALINSSHIAQYTQCTLGGGSCKQFPGGAGEYTDYYLYITANQDEHCQSGAVAWALPCLSDDATNRPLLGSANICPQALMNTDQESGVAVLLHELTHALGFTDDMFDKFISADGTPIPKSDVVQSFVDPSGTSTSMIITPTVVKETRAQFNCDTVPGAALENEGGQGSANAHWEYRWFQSELMVATNLFAVYGKPATLSRITLAFMQDTGWYDVDMDAAGFLNWGYQAGCDFLNSECTAYVAKYPNQQYYCTQADAASTSTVNTVCTFDGMARARCTNAQFADGCIMKMALGDPPRYNCLSTKYAAAAGDKFGWQNGLDSRCIPVTWLFNTFTYQFPDSSYKAGWKDSMCYQSRCTAAGELQLDILGSKVSCPSGQMVDLGKVLPQQFQSGMIGPCPDNAAMCKSLSCNDSCTVGGTCVGGKCHCNLMYMGPDCAKKLTPDGNYTNYVPVVDDGKAGGTSQTYDAGYLMMSARIQNDQEQLYLSLDKYRTAVSQLAGVTTSRVAVLSFLTDAPATSLVGHHRRLTSTSSGSSAAIADADGGDGGDGDEAFEWAAQAGGAGHDLQHFQLHSSSRSLLQSGQLEVYSRIATLNQADADAIVSRINNATRQAEFEKQLASAGLKLVAGSISVRDTAGNQKTGWGLPNMNWGDPNTKRIIIIVACSVGAALLAMLLGWAVSCCMRRRRSRRQQNHLQQQFIMRPGGYHGGTPAAPTSSSSNRGNSLRPFFGASAAPAGGIARQTTTPYVAAAAGGGRANGRPVNPFAGTNIQFNSTGGGRGGAYTAPPAAATFGLSAGGSGVPVGGYVVQGRTFRTAQEAEEHQLAIALQRSLQQTGPPGSYLPHSDGSSTGQQPWQTARHQQQQQQPAGYPPVQSAYSRSPFAGL